MLHTLPAEVLQRVLRGADQETLTHGLFLASKGLYAAARDPSLWREVYLDELDASALRFVGTTATACERLFIENPCPDDVGLFLEDLSTRYPEVAEDIQAINVCIPGRCTRVPNHLIEAICAGYPSLRTLTIRLQGGVEDENNDLVFPPRTRLALLEELEISEVPDDDDDPNLCVYFGAGAAKTMPSLRKISLRLGNSDVLCSDVISNLPALAVLVYRSDYEGYDPETLRMDGVSLDFLSVSIHDNSDFPNLLRALAGCARPVGTLVVRAHSDVTFGAGVPANRLSVQVLEPGAIVQFDYQSLLNDSPDLRRLAVLTSDEDEEEEEVCVRFVAVPCATDWIKLHGALKMVLSPFARIELTSYYY